MFTRRHGKLAGGVRTTTVAISTHLGRRNIDYLAGVALDHAVVPGAIRGCRCGSHRTEELLE